MCFIKLVIKICFPARPNMPFSGDISLPYLHNIYEWELESGVGVGGEGKTYFYSNFYETHSIWHFKQK